jgi:outer membrane protein assembly factor BamD (BamD/ComL family)
MWTNVGPAVAATVATVALAAAIIGCAPPEDNVPGGAPGQAAVNQQPLKRKDVEPVLNQAYAAFDAKQLDAAMTGADRVLIGNRDGTGAAEAHYLRGRVFEERAAQASDPALAKAALANARTAYNAALAAHPAPELDARVHAGIANAAYFQDDYATAIAEFSVASNKLTEPTSKAWALYRVGLSQQRFGNFDEADQTFAKVQQGFPNTEPARRAGQHQGARGFHVQIGTYSTPANAQNAVATLRADGVIGTQQSDPAGRVVVRVGPVPTYDQARALKSRLAAKYPDALIIP